MARRRYYKGLQTSLQGPHFNNPDGALYLPGTEHHSELVVADAFGAGIHFTAHQRVAARWAPVVAEVTVLGSTFLIPEKVAPRFRGDVPRNLTMGRYNKYRTDHVRIERIVGLAAYEDWNGQGRADGMLEQLNATLTARGRRPMRFTGKVLERLRSNSFLLRELEEPPEGRRWKVELAVEAADSQQAISKVLTALERGDVSWLDWSTEELEG